jgi:hypothetical protein
MGVLPDKDLWSPLMRFLIAKAKPDEYVFICEARFKAFDPKDEFQQLESRMIAGGSKAVSDFEDKQECLVITHEERGGSESVGVVRFQRVDGSVNFSELEWFPESGGRFTGLWNPFGDGDGLGRN